MIRPPPRSTRTHNAFPTRRSPDLFALTNNLGRLYTDGFDLLMNYNTDVGFANLAWSFVGNWTRHSKFNANVASPDSLNRECVGYRSEEHTSELQSLMRISYAVFCLKKKKRQTKKNNHEKTQQHT